MLTSFRACGITAAVAVATVCSSLGQVDQKRSVLAESTSWSAPKWSVAAIFRRQGPRLVFLKLVSDPVVSPRSGLAPASGRSDEQKEFKADYEIWLIANGRMQAIAYDSVRHTSGPVQRGQIGTLASDDGALDRLLRSKATIMAGPALANRSQVSAMRPGPYERLTELVTNSSLIVTGRVIGILRNERHPEGSPYWAQHTVFLVAVDRTLKDDRRLNSPIVKVWQNGGNRTWIEPDGKPGKMGYEMEDDPLLQVGSRYLLCLNQPDDSRGIWHSRGYYGGSTYDRTGKVAELDEFRIADVSHGKILLMDGRSLSSNTLGSGAMAHWRFREGLQIIDVPEADAVAAVSAAVKSESTLKL